MQTLGRHFLVDLYGCRAQALDDAEGLRMLLCRAAGAAGAKVVADLFHPFLPQGVSGVVAIEESHLSIHTWPERGYAALDFYTCGSADAEHAVTLIADALLAARIEILEVTRGADAESTLHLAMRKRIERP